MRESFRLGTSEIAPGQRATVELPVSVLPDHTPANLSAHVIHGRKPGPVVFVSAAIHGDEVIGVEIVRRLLRAAPVARLSGTLIAVPVVNAFGFLNRSRYLPDRRDLNRSFPGSAEGSLASRLADLFLRDIVSRCDYGIDLHSAAEGRENLPQMRLSPGAKELSRLAEAFAAPVTLVSKVRDGSLRLEAAKLGCPVLLYEAGEGLRLDEAAARSGVSGVLRVMAALGMIGARGVPRGRAPSVLCERSHWLRAPSGGLLRNLRASGDFVAPGDVLGVVSDPFGETEREVLAETAGVIVGRRTQPVVMEGDALYHVAEPKAREHAEARVEAHLAEDLPQAEAALFDEDEIL